MAYEIGPGEKAKFVGGGTERTPGGEKIEYAWYSGRLGPHEGIVVIKTDRFGMRWRLELPRHANVTVRVAAGLLNVTPMTVSNWIRDGVFQGVLRGKKAVMIPVRDIERVAKLRGITLPFSQ